MQEPSPSDKVPVTIITGFLGAGKTTFLKYVLTQKHGNKILVIQNEFGAEIGLEQATIVNQDGGSSQEWLELANGCICCTVKDSFVATIENLMAKKAKFDFIFIETDGLADPGPVASVFWLDDALESHLQLDGIVAIVDAKHILQHLDEPKPSGVVNEAQRQVALADRIIVNKIDLVSKQELRAVEARIREINAAASICFTQRSEVNLEQVLRLGSFELTQALRADFQQKMAALEQYSDADCASAHCSDQRHHHSDHKHDEGVHTIKLTAGDVDEADFTRWLGSWLWCEEAPKRTEIFRVKGLVAVKGAPEKYMLQGVHTLFDLQPSTVRWQATEPRATMVVLIGRHLDPVLASWPSLTPKL